MDDHHLYIHGGSNSVNPDDKDFVIYDDFLVLDMDTLTFESKKIKNGEGKGRNSHSSFIYDRFLFEFFGIFRPNIYIFIGFGGKNKAVTDFQIIDIKKLEIVEKFVPLPLEYRKTLEPSEHDIFINLTAYRELEAINNFKYSFYISLGSSLSVLLLSLSFLLYRFILSIRNLNNQVYLFKK